ncbi:unnamed protein product, partial [Urochloa decumbens]
MESMEESKLGSTNYSPANKGKPIGIGGRTEWTDLHSDSARSGRPAADRRGGWRSAAAPPCRLQLQWLCARFGLGIGNRVAWDEKGRRAASERDLLAGGWLPPPLHLSGSERWSGLSFPQFI